MSPLHLAIFCGQDNIAKDIIQRTNSEDLNLTFGVYSLLIVKGRKYSITFSYFSRC